jgi:hypothetical protein
LLWTTRILSTTKVERGQRKSENQNRKHPGDSAPFAQNTLLLLTKIIMNNNPDLLDSDENPSGTLSDTPESQSSSKSEIYYRTNENSKRILFAMGLGIHVKKNDDGNYEYLADSEMDDTPVEDVVHLADTTLDVWAKAPKKRIFVPTVRDLRAEIERRTTDYGAVN